MSPHVRLRQKVSSRAAGSVNALAAVKPAPALALGTGSARVLNLRLGPKV